jgi:NAD(P)-dependent dehydrogenase (short-subunit alcohol dehydrogenase family)
MKAQKVWFVTGTSKGLGLALVKKLLAEGFRVAATSRNLPALLRETGEKSNNFLPLEMDVVNEQSVKETIKKTITHFGTIDVVVNNAGYGQLGTLEELSDEEARTCFDVNVFGVLNVIRQVMPHLRKNGSGHVFNISSIGGYSAKFPGAGIYCATKFAVAALSEGLSAEVKDFNVKVTLIYPGYFRTNFLDQGSLKTPQNPIDDYIAARASQSFHEHQMNGNQPGDPDKAAGVLIKMSNEEHPPLHLFLGQDAYDMAYAKMEDVKEDLAQWKVDTLSTSFVESVLK